MVWMSLPIASIKMKITFFFFLHVPLPVEKNTEMNLWCATNNKFTPRATAIFRYSCLHCQHTCLRIQFLMLRGIIITVYLSRDKISPKDCLQKVMVTAYMWPYTMKILTQLVVVSQCACLIAYLKAYSQISYWGHSKKFENSNSLDLYL